MQRGASRLTVFAPGPLETGIELNAVLLTSPTETLLKTQNYFSNLLNQNVGRGRQLEYGHQRRACSDISDVSFYCTYCDVELFGNYCIATTFNNKL